MIGKTVSHYKIIEKLGEGGMGVVYKAEDTTLKRTVAALTPERVLELAIQVAEALREAHTKGIVHPDIKPANTMIDPGGHGRSWTSV